MKLATFVFNCMLHMWCGVELASTCVDDRDKRDWIGITFLFFLKWWIVYWFNSFCEHLRTKEVPNRKVENMQQFKIICFKLTYLCMYFSKLFYFWTTLQYRTGWLVQSCYMWLSAAESIKAWNLKYKLYLYF